jgi:hypothetical protein
MEQWIIPIVTVLLSITGTIITIKLMPHDIANKDSETIKNLFETVRKMQDRIDELESRVVPSIIRAEFHIDYPGLALKSHSIEYVEYE